MTERQKRDILTLRDRGQTYAAIAGKLGLPLNTVKSYCQRSKGNHPAEGSFCRNCGEPLAHSAKVRQKSFCCNHCRNAWWNNHRDQLNHRDARTQMCLYCGCDFETFGKRGQKYCCHECYIADRYGEGGKR